MENLKLQILTEEEIKKIHACSLDILSTVGVSVGDSEARSIFKKAGCSVDESSKVVRIPPSIVDECLHSVPKSFILHGRDSKFDVKMVGDGSVTNYINLGIGTRTAIYNGDGSYDIRDATLRDEANFAMVLESCENINWFTQPASAMDLINTKCARSLHEVDAMMSNCAKPFLPDPDVNYIDTYFEMIKTVYSGDEEEARKRPFFIIGGTTSSPLQLDAHMCQLYIRACRNSLPVMTMTMEMAGTTSPIHLAGTLVLHNCEALTNVVLAQLCRKGTPVIYGTATTAFDFVDSTAPFGCPEAALLSSALAQIAQFYGLPNITTGGGSDSIHVDAQAGHESTLTAMLTQLAGSNNVFGSGLIELGMTFSLEELVLRDEMISMEKRVKHGIRVDDETLSVDAIKAIGIAGDFITRPETIANFDSMSKTLTFNRKMYDDWINSDPRDALDRAHAKVTDILFNYQPTPVDSDVRKQLDQIIINADKAEGATESTQNLLDRVHHL
ncbi:trimethylamine methyltransferase family protein [Methanomassiliicoccales archaeon LGM-RCC1]|nr:trimethylamine methyltransferase family protein [Methanomassiliicoccales archaeon LGM-RCC1]